MTKFYLVGGAVRDLYMGIKPSDYDFTVVADSFEDMVSAVREKGGEIFLSKPEFGTVRAAVPGESLAAFDSDEFPLPKTIAADFVLARKDGYYSDGRHPDSVEPGTLLDDLARRDFTINAIAFSESGEVIDPYDGAGDINYNLLKAVGDPVNRLTEDALRAVRAIRFAVTKDMTINHALSEALSHAGVLYNLEHKISSERVREELLKAFRYDTLNTLKVLARFPLVTEVILREEGNVWLKPTSEEK